MGLFEKVAKVVMVFQSDTKDLEAGVKKMQGLEKEHTKQILEGVKQRNSALDQWSQRLANANQILELGTKAVQFAAEAWKEYEKAAMKAGDEQASKAREMRNAINAWNESMRQTKIAIGEVVASMAPMIRSLAQVVTHLNDIGTAMQKMGVGGNFGALFEYGQGGGLAAVGGSGIGIGAGLTGVGDARHNAYQAEAARRREEVARAYYGDRLKSNQMTMADIQTALVGDALDEKKRGGAGPRVSPFAPYFRSADIGGGVGGAGRWLSGWASPNAASSGLGSSAYAGIGSAGIPVSHANMGSDWKGMDLSKTLEQAAKLESQVKGDILQSIFGPLDQFDAYAEKMQLLGDAVGIFGGALQGGFDAWVQGSLTAAQAIKQAFAQTIQGIASSLFAHAIEHGAAAIGNLAWGNLAGAALHGKAAAGYAAGALAVGGIARTLGGAGNGASAGAGAGGGAPVAGYGSSSSSGSVTNVYVGDSMSGSDGARFRRQRLERDLQLAKRNTDDEAVRWS